MIASGVRGRVKFGKPIDGLHKAEAGVMCVQLAHCLPGAFCGKRSFYEKEIGVFYGLRRNACSGYGVCTGKGCCSGLARSD